MAEQKLQDLPGPVQELVSRILGIFIESGPRGLAEKGLFPMAEVPVAEERCGDFGGRFRVPPSDAPVYVYIDGNVCDVELPLWLAGEDDRSDLFIFLEVDPVAGTARMTDIRAP